jgi:predicted DNA-binding protein (MmcQ/YjbR family)
MRRVCAALPAAVEVEAWGHPTFRVNAQIFAAVERYKKRPCIAISADRDEQEVLIERFGFFKSPYVGNRGWVSVWVDEPAPAGIMRDLVKRAYRRLARSKPPTSARRKRG